MHIIEIVLVYHYLKTLSITKCFVSRKSAKCNILCDVLVTDVLVTMVTDVLITGVLVTMGTDVLVTDVLVVCDISICVRLSLTALLEYYTGASGIIGRA